MTTQFPFVARLQMAQQAMGCSILRDTVAEFRPLLRKRIGTVLSIRKSLHSVNL